MVNTKGRLEYEDYETEVQLGEVIQSTVFDILHDVLNARDIIYCT